MTQLEKAVAASGNIAFSMKFSLGFPAEILSAANPFSDGTYIKFGDLVHPDDYQPFCEVINDIVNGSVNEIRVHSRIRTCNEYIWYYITGEAVRNTNGLLESIDGMMFNVSGYLDCDTEDAVIRRFRSKHAAALTAGEHNYTLRDILGEDYLVRIQNPFVHIDGLYSAIVDSSGRVISATGKQDKHFNMNKLDFQRKKNIRVRHKTIASWIIAGNDQNVVDSNAQLLETMAQTVAGVANSYVVLVEEMENSQNANKLLGQTFEDQILVNNTYSLILNSPDTRAAMSGIIPLISEYFGLSDMMFCSETDDPVKVYRWDNSGMLLPVMCASHDIKSLKDELDYSGIVCTDRRTMQADHDGRNLSCVMVRTYDGGKDSGVIVYTADTSNRTWSNRERKLLKSITQIISTVIYKIFMEDELATSQARLERIAYYHSATGIPNRSMLERDFPKEIAEGKNGAIIAFEISNIKSISEIYGYEYADDVLKSFAEYVSAVPCSAVKKVYRFSSDILFMTLSGAEREEARQFAQAILTKFRSPWYLEDNEQRLQVYAGVMLYPSDASDIDHCIIAANQTLRLAKEKELNDAACYSEGLEEQLINNRITKKLIAQAVENDFEGFYFLYQPVIDINTGSLHCCEASLFWENDELTIPRDQIMPIIDQLGLSKEIYRYVVDNICSFCATVREAGVEQFRVSFPIPENILSTEVSIEALRSALLEYSLPPSAVSVSISEDEKTLYAGNIFLNQMAKIGVNIIADDIGGGYFSIAPLENSAVKTIKIRSSRFSDDAVSASFLQSVIRLAHEKDITVCARGVDSAAIFQSIRRFNVDLVEGIFNGRPLRDKEFMDKLVFSSPARRTVH
ncbi:MAG: EAL domain-containing protein [Oscillospiraceae bacterium]|nr:EAL domain-containing protein [Oscillospiraceae bacterium]